MYEDRSYPPIGPTLVYRRGDGALVQLSVTAAEDATPFEGVPLPHLPASLVTQQQVVAPPMEQYSTLPPAVAMSASARLTAFLFFRHTTPVSQQLASLESLLGTTSRDDVTVCVVMQGPGPEASKFIEKYMGTRFVAQGYVFGADTDKFAAMRRVWHDNAWPIRTPWVMWMDDCVFADVASNWADQVKSMLDRCAQRNEHLLGMQFGQAVNAQFRNWIKKRPWYKGKQLRDRRGRPHQDGSHTFFVQDQCFIVSQHAIQQCDLPDPTANKYYGAAILGEQVYQHGLGVKTFNTSQQFLRVAEKQVLAGTWPQPGTPKYAPGPCGDWYRLAEKGPPLPVQTVVREAPVEVEHVVVGQWNIIVPPPLAVS